MLKRKQNENQENAENSFHAQDSNESPLKSQRSAAYSSFVPEKKILGEISGNKSAASHDLYSTGKKSHEIEANCLPDLKNLDVEDHECELDAATNDDESSVDCHDTQETDSSSEASEDELNASSLDTDNTDESDDDDADNSDTDQEDEEPFEETLEFESSLNALEKLLASKTTSSASVSTPATAEVNKILNSLSNMTQPLAILLENDYKNDLQPNSDVPDVLKGNDLQRYNLLKSDAMRFNIASVTLTLFIDTNNVPPKKKILTLNEEEKIVNTANNPLKVKHVTDWHGPSQPTFKNVHSADPMIQMDVAFENIINVGATENQIDHWWFEKIFPKSL